MKRALTALWDSPLALPCRLVVGLFAGFFVATLYCIRDRGQR